MRFRNRVLVLFLFLFLSGGYLLWWFFHDLPDLKVDESRKSLPSIQITDRYGRLLYEVLAEETGRHVVVSLEDMPQDLLYATIATEDSHFYENPGVDLEGIVRSLWINVQGDSTLVGGSTITQQVVRNLLLSSEEQFEVSIRRKVREIYLAWRLTQKLSKDEILALYLNHVYYGGLAYGVEAASQTYYGKPVSELDLAECALLAGLPQAPAVYNPYTNPEAAEERQAVVLGLMEKQGYISPEERKMAEREPLIFQATPYPAEALHYVMMVRSELDELLGLDGESAEKKMSQYDGLIVRTSLDLDWQHQAERSVLYQMKALQQNNSEIDYNLNSMALVAIDVETGEVRALVGSPDYFDPDTGGAINMAVSPRQPGSALKPLVYAAAFDPEREDAWTAATMIMDVDTSFVTHDGKSYVPKNYDNQEHGPVLVRQALGSSLNMPAVAAMDYVGIVDLFNLAAKLGISTFESPEQYDLSLALGGGEVRLIELTAAYGAFANGGYRIEPVLILEIADIGGREIYSYEKPPLTRVMDERVAWLISDILSDDDARVLGFGKNSVLQIDRPAAVKTGTTSNFHDNWTIGYTPEVVVGVWAGNTNHEPMRNITGLTGAAPVWHQFIRAILSGTAEQKFTRPEGLVEMEVCSLSGLLPGDDCIYRKNEWFIEGTQPKTFDPFFQWIEIDVETGMLANESTATSYTQEKLVFDLPPEAHDWARKEGLPLIGDYVESGVFSTGEEDYGLKILSPPSHAVYQLTDSIPYDLQRIKIEAAVGVELSELQLLMDGKPIAEFQSGPYRIYWMLEEGIHEVWAVGEAVDGELLESNRIHFEVKDEKE